MYISYAQFKRALHMTQKRPRDLGSLANELVGSWMTNSFSYVSYTRLWDFCGACPTHENTMQFPCAKAQGRSWITNSFSSETYKKLWDFTYTTHSHGKKRNPICYIRYPNVRNPIRLHEDIPI